MNAPLPFEDLEKAYDRVAQAIDAAGADREALFLTKLCLVLAHHLGDLAILEKAVAAAKADLDA